ncbi:MAG: SDR family oxidoreductase [Candidatus Omnitrophica bacterium]|nr:SDR family oxidoreductase [Candidatus Omnitrophota bacterium]
MTNKPRTLFLTGVTGTLGKEIVRNLLTQTQHKLYVLIRSKPNASHWDRARKILENYGLEKHLGDRVHVMAGDVTLPNLGFSAGDLDLLRKEVDDFYHIAALTALNGSKEDCFRINLGGAQEALKIATDFWQHGHLKRFVYFSTAFVAGSLQTYCSKEDELPLRPVHANFYEASKYEAEKKVREAMRQGLPCTIFRPSIVVGDSQTGEVSEFNVIYPFIRLFAHGILSKLPTRLDNSFNIVPIDFVIQASLAIAHQEDSIQKTFHLITKDPPTVAMLLELKAKEYPKMPPIQVLSPDDFKPGSLAVTEQFVFGMLKPYLGYLNDHLTFDATNTEKALAGTGISFPKTDYEFLKTLTQYAVGAGYLLPQ